MGKQNTGESAVRCLRYLEAFDFAGMRAMCTEGATVWHNDGKGELTLAEKVEQLKPLASSVDSLRYDITRQFRDGDEVLQQQVLRLVTRGGAVREVHATMYFRFDGELIERIEEFVHAVPTAQAQK